MPEIQNTPQQGDHVARFIEFVLMHSQQAALCLGQIPHPQTGKPATNLPLARMFIDQLEMIREKTRGNLNQDESAVLANALGNLQMEYVRAADAAVNPPASGAPAPAPVPEGSDPGKGS